MGTLGIEPRASRMLSGCDTTTPHALDKEALAKRYPGARSGMSQLPWRLTPYQKVGSSNLPALRVLYANEKHIACLQRARGVVVSHPLSMREALGSIPSVSMDACQTA